MRVSTMQRTYARFPWAAMSLSRPSVDMSRSAFSPLLGVNRTWLELATTSESHSKRKRAAEVPVSDQSRRWSRPSIVADENTAMSGLFRRRRQRNFRNLLILGISEVDHNAPGNTFNVEVFDQESPCTEMIFVVLANFIISRKSTISVLGNWARRRRRVRLRKPERMPIAVEPSNKRT